MRAAPSKELKPPAQPSPRGVSGRVEAWPANQGPTEGSPRTRHEAEVAVARRQDGDVRCDLLRSTQSFASGHREEMLHLRMPNHASCLRRCCGRISESLVAGSAKEFTHVQTTRGRAPGTCSNLFTTGNSRPKTEDKTMP